MALLPQLLSCLRRPDVQYLPLAQATPAVETRLAWRRDNASPVLLVFLALMRETL